MNQIIDYWNNYYSASIQHQPIPSQFAVFVANEMEDKCTNILELGCGNGRDTLFFASQGHKILALDASEKAIQTAQHHCTGLNNVTFLCSQIATLQKNQIDNILDLHNKLFVYARFFLHAISEEDENTLLEFLYDICLKNSILAFEFRTIKDLLLHKETEQHYRRFLTPLNLINKLHDKNFLSYYYIEGFGYAKHKNDDAYVARILARKIK